MSDVIPSEEARTQLEEATQRQSDIQINNLQDVL